MNVNFTIKKRHGLIFLALIALATAATALAAWLVMGNGNGHYKIGNLQAVTVTPAPTFPAGATAPLPGGSGDVGILVTNPNSTALLLTGWSLTGGGVFQSNELPAGCNASDFSAIASDGTWTPVTIPANAVSFAVTVKKAYTMSANAGTACQGTDGTTSNSTPPWRFIFSTP